MQGVQAVSPEHKALCLKVIGRANSYLPHLLEWKCKKGQDR